VRLAIFLGPSLPLADARSILADATYLPPAQQADIASLASREDKPDAIGLIDGVFMQSLSVWHNELLYAMHRGVRIFGASSIGALRAAETAPFGAVGVGAIYRMYADGTLEDDDEVALAYSFDRPTARYVKTSEPMVNIRATLHAAADRDEITYAVCAEAIGVAKAIYFPERNIPAFLALASENSLLAPHLDSLAAALRDHYVDLKRLDAIELLETLARPEPEPPGRGQEFAFDPSYVFETLYNRDRVVTHDGTELPLARISKYVAVHHPDFDQLSADAFNRTLASVLGTLIGVSVNDQEVEFESKRFRRRWRLEDDAAVASWCTANDVNHAEFRQLMREAAVARKLRHWLVSNRYLDRNSRFVLDHLRVSGGYSEWAQRAADQEVTIQRHHPGLVRATASVPSMEELLAEQVAYSGWSVPIDLPALCDELGFRDAEEFRHELLRAQRFRQVHARVEAVLSQLAVDGDDFDGDRPLAGDAADRTA
jgi:hypothetical protein